MAAFKNPYTDYVDKGLDYEFITEISPSVWKISRKKDRMEYLAQEVTDLLFTDADDDDQKLTDYGRLLAPDGEGLIEQVKVVLNHPNLVSLVDFFALQFTNFGSSSRKQWFIVWDYCDAGNLGNLLVSSQPRPQDRVSSPEPDGENGDIKIEDAPPVSEEEEEEEEDVKFLPESLVWHVLTSVLRALAWLHDGVRDVVLEGHTWKRLGGDPDWSPMLHRAITPENIFIGHPRRKEWYGPVKLGNYGRLFISGHYQASGEKHAPTFTKVIGPHPSQDIALLEDLVAADVAYGSIYPHQPLQPYTIISEYRALGEIVQAMMVEPTGGDHIKRIQSRPVRTNLKDTTYTGRLKNFVVKLMEFDPWNSVAIADPTTYVTSDLYREALEAVEVFMATGRDEAESYVPSKWAEAEDRFENTTLKVNELYNSFENVKDVLETFSKC
ncbi:hypothetical protein F5Y03DRAFT_181309 [Xylaria venustula]|nr:hypothetical protein F5Y03DRAFT_181309 [Xylaria venustula]